MSPAAFPFLSPERARIFRITHIANLPWILDHGLHCANSSVRDPDFVAIGNPDLIGKRARKLVAVTPGGTLSDYVPFYFTPRTPMMLNIVTGYRVPRVARSDIVIMVASLPRIHSTGIDFLVADRHANLLTATITAGLSAVSGLDWPRLQSCDFRRRDDELERFDRYQAEALIHRHLPATLLDALVCYGTAQQGPLASAVKDRGLNFSVSPQPDWYC